MAVVGARDVIQIQAVDPAIVVDTPGPVRAVAAFALVLLLGGGLLWRYEPFVERSMDAMLARPLSSIGYGIAAHAVIGFAGFYLASQLTYVDVGGQNAGGIGLLIGGLLVGLAGALGFTVVGAAVLDLWGSGTNWSGLVVGSVVAGVIAGIDPLVAGLGWIAIVSAGIGGQARTWLHASVVADI